MLVLFNSATLGECCIYFTKQFYIKNYFIYSPELIRFYLLEIFRVVNFCLRFVGIAEFLFVQYGT